MANKFLDDNGLLYFWQKIVNKFVAKEDGKGLSSNDYTATEKTKLSGIADGANKTTVTDNLTSTSTTDALSANQGKVLDDKIKAINTNLGELGAGDMLKSTYDVDDNGQVDKADDTDKLGGQLPAYYAKAADIPENVSDLTNDANYIKTSEVETKINTLTNDIDTKLAKKANDDDLATVAKTGSYNDLTDKPTDFAPSSHNHAMTDVTGLEDALAGKSATGHKHTTSDITDFSTEMAKKANASHTHEITNVNGLQTKLDNMVAVAEGKRTSYVFDTVDDMNTWVANTSNTTNLKTGDVFLIRATDVPDYWWDATTSSVQILETTKVDLTTITNAEIDTIVAS